MYNKNILKHKKSILTFTILISVLLTSESYSQTEITHGNSPFNRGIIFGDSLSDNGNYSDFQTLLKGQTTTEGRFSNGQVWDEYLFANQKRGFKTGRFLPYWSKNGDFGDQTGNQDINVNYSVGGATYFPTDSNYIPSIAEQIDTYINGKDGTPNRISPKTLVSLWAGANDALNALEKGLSPKDKAAAVKQKISEALERLYQAGGRQFLAPDLPDFGKVPRFNTGDSPLPHATSEAFNAAYAEAIADFKGKHPDATVYAPKMGGLLDTVMRYSELFGYKNVKEACIKISACKKASTGSSAQNEYMFWDEIHPTTGTHEYIANYMREYWLNPDLAGFYVTSRKGQFETERNFFFPTTDKIVSGYLTGNKALYKLNDAKLTLTGDHSYTGGTVIKDGELELGNGGTTGSIIGDVDTNSTAVFSFNRRDIVSFDGKISGAGRVNQKGYGLTILTGQSTYSGPTGITAGELMVNGSLTSKVQVYSGGTLSGTGAIGGLLAESGSFLFPGDFRKAKTATLNVNGDADLKRGSTLGIRVNADGTSSVLDVSGSVTLGGIVIFNRDQRAVRLSVAQTFDLLGKTSTFLKYGGQISGKFEKVEPSYKFFGAALGYNPHEVNVTFTRNDRRFAREATTANEKTVANAVEELGRHNQLYDNIIVSTFDDNLSGTYSQLTGDLYASLQTSLLLDSNLTRDAVQQRMADVFDNRILPSQGVNAPLTNGAWGQLYNSNARWNSDGNAKSMKRSLTGFITGIDMTVANDWQLGVFTGYMNASLNSASSSATIDTYQLGAYGGREWDRLKFSFGASASLHDIDSRRSFSFREINNKNQASFRGNSFQSFAELSYAFETPLAQISPFAGLSYTHVKTNAFSENTSATALSGSSNKADAFSTLLGLRLTQNYALSESAGLGVNLLAGWQHNSNTLPLADLNFADGNSFTISGLPLARDALVLQTGVQFNLRQNTSLGLSYKGQLGKNIKDHTVKADFTIRF